MFAGLLATLLLAIGFVAPQTTSPAEAASMTTLTFKVSGCGSCSLQLVNPDSDAWWESATKKVRGGKVSFKVPTNHTRGLTAEVSSRKETQPWSRTMLVFRYGGQAVGGKVTAKQAANAKKAYPRWAGRRAGGSTTIKIKVDWFRAYDETFQTRVTYMRPYAIKGVATSGKAWDAYDGRVGNQGYS